jgi:PAS domain S-box-containing protein
MGNRSAETTIGEADARLPHPEQFEFAHDCYLVTDRQGVIVEANDVAVLLLDCRKEFLIGKPIGKFVANEVRSLLYEHLNRLYGGERMMSFESQIGRHGLWRDVLVLPVLSNTDNMCRWIFRDITHYKQAERDRAELLRQLVTAQEDERRRISRELHDSIGQLLAGLTMAVKAARAADLPPRVHTVLDDVQRISDELSRSAHEFAVRLRPTALDDLGLVPAVEQLLAKIAARAPFEVDFHAQGMNGQRLPTEVETVLYRVVQEAVTNAVRHASPSHVSVLASRTDEDVTLAVEDDGIGFHPDRTHAATDHPPLGLVGMKERVGLIGGTLQVESSPGRGTTVIVRIPLAGGSDRGYIPNASLNRVGAPR